MSWIWLPLALVPIAIAASGIILCLPYWRSPEKRWRDRVLRAYQAARRQVHSEETELERLSKNRRDQIQVLSRRAFELFLSSISVNELDAYPGIGPATVGRLKGAGYDNLAKLQSARLRVRGLGQKRLQDINGAVRQLTREAESRFQAGGCPQAQQLAAQLQQLEALFAELDSPAKARAKAAADVVRQLEPFVAIARRVTFWDYFWKDAHAVVPPEVLQHALPDLRAALTSAEQRASKPLRGREAAETSGSEIRSRKAVPAGTAASRLEAIPVAQPGASARPAANTTPAREKARPERPAVQSAERRSSSLDSAPSPPANRSVPQPQTANDPAQELLEATLGFAFAIARTDGSISRKERELLDQHVQHRYGHDAVLYNRAKAWWAYYETGAIEIGNCLERIQEGFTPAQRAELFEFACQLAGASGPMNQREVRLLERASREWGVPWKPPAVVPVPPPQPTISVPAPTVVSQSPPVLEPRALLEIEPTVQLTADLIRRQYNLLCSRLAPEKLESLGPEFLAMAQSKRQAIRAAAETLLQPLGEPLDLPTQPAEPTELRHNPDLDAMFGA